MQSLTGGSFPLFRWMGDRRRTPLYHAHTLHDCSRVEGSPSPSPPPHHTTTVLRPFFRDHPGEPVPEENCWTLWCKGRLTEADTPAIRLGATPSGLTSAHLHHHPILFLQAGCPSCRLTSNQQCQSTEGNSPSPHTKNQLDPFRCLVTIHERYRQTDRQTDGFTVAQIRRRKSA